MIKSLLDRGFIIKDFRELYGNEEIKIGDKYAESLTNEFPLWWFYKLEPEKQKYCQ